MPRIGDYDIGKELGKGAYGRVYLGVDRKLKCKVAIKVIRHHYASVIREAKLLQYCRHEHVLGILDYMISEQTGVIVLELMKTSLGSIRKRFTFVEVRRLMKQLLLAVAACHQKQVCHLDIKPENILLDDQNNLKLADFGIASQSRNNECLQRAAFTPGYRPPEVVFGAEFDGYKADIWAVGLVIAFLFLKNKCLLEIKLHQGVDESLVILEQICGVFGKPDEASWPGVSNTPKYHLLQQVTANGPGLVKTFKLRHSCPPKPALQLLEKMLTIDPCKRITAEEALQSEYLRG